MADAPTIGRKGASFDVAAFFRRYAALTALIVLLAFNFAVTPNFASWQTLNVNLTQVATIVIVSVGMTLVIATGGIDLSVGSLMAISGALAPMIADKHRDHFLREHVAQTEHARRRLGHYVTKGPGIKPIRPEYVAAVLSELADDDAVFTVDTGTPCIWAARHIEYGRDRRMLGSFTWASMACASPYGFGAAMAFPGRQVIALCGDGGFTMGGLGDLLTQVQRKARVVNVIINNGMLDFVNIEQQEAGIVPFGTEFTNPDFSQVATALGARGMGYEHLDQLALEHLYGTR